MTAAVEVELDELALSIVCDERVAMALVGADRVEAIRRLAAKGVPDNEIADLLKTTHGAITRYRNLHHIKAGKPRGFGWYPILDSRRKRRHE